MSSLTFDSTAGLLPRPIGAPTLVFLAVELVCGPPAAAASPHCVAIRTSLCDIHVRALLGIANETWHWRHSTQRTAALRTGCRRRFRLSSSL